MPARKTRRTLCSLLALIMLVSIIIIPSTVLAAPVPATPVAADGWVYAVRTTLPVLPIVVNTNQTLNNLASATSYRWYWNQWWGPEQWGGSPVTDYAFTEPRLTATLLNATNARWAVFEFESAPAAGAEIRFGYGSGANSNEPPTANLLTQTGDGAKTVFAFDTQGITGRLTDNLRIWLLKPDGLSLKQAYLSDARSEAGDITTVQFHSFAANGTPNEVTTTELILTFNAPITGLLASDIAVVGATAGTLSPPMSIPDFAGTVYYLTISDLTVPQDGIITATVTKSGYNIVPPSMSVLANVQQIIVPPANPARYPFPQVGNFKLAVDRVMPSNRTQEQMNQDVIDQFKKILQDYFIEQGTANSNNPDEFRMALYHTSGGGASNNQVTCSESMGYGMLMLALMAGSDEHFTNNSVANQNLRTVGDRQLTIKDYYDGMFRTLRDFPSTGTGGSPSGRGTMMAWELVADGRVTGGAWPGDAGPWRNTGNSASSATDGDLDMIYSLLLADMQWGSDGKYDYAAHAQGMLNSFWRQIIDHNGSRTPYYYHMKVGNWVGTGARADGTRPSDFIMSHLKAFKEFDSNPNNQWERPIDVTYKAIADITQKQTPVNGLLPGFAIVNRSTGIWDHVADGVSWLEGTGDSRYEYNACRVPWRQGTDVMLYGDTTMPTGREIGTTSLVDTCLRPLHNFLLSEAGGNAAGTFSGIRRNFFMNGTSPASGSGGSAFSSPVLVSAAVLGTTAQMNDGWNYARTLNRQANQYGDYINVLSMITASGNYWCPILMAEQGKAEDATRETWKLIDWKVAPEKAISLAPWKEAGVGTGASAVATDTAGWVPAKAPGTVVGALIDAKKYDDIFVANNDGEKDVYFDVNAQNIPRDDFADWWWYSIDVNVPADQIGKKFNLNLKQISYWGEVFVNGTEVFNENLNITDDRELQNKTGTGAATGNGSNPLPPYSFDSVGIGINGGFPGGNAAWSTLTESPGSKSSVAMWGNDDFDLYKNKFIGTYRSYDVDITDQIKAGDNNIKVRVKRMYNVVDFGPFYHDWHPAAPDNNMGLNGNVTLTATGAARLSSPMAASKIERGSIDAAGNGNADLSFYVDVTNMTKAPIEVEITAVVKDPSGIVVPGFENIVKTVTIPAGYYNWDVPVVEGKRLDNAKLWWTYGTNGIGNQPLYTIEYVVKSNGALSDNLTHRFGIRELVHEVNNYASANNAHAVQVYINHQPLTMKGGGFSALDMYYRHDDLANKNFIEIVKSLGHNFWRDEGKFFSEDLYEMMDEAGLLLMTGYMCCDRNEATNGADTGTGRIDLWSKAERFIVYETTYSQMRIIRQYAAAWAWLNGSDRPKSVATGTGANALGQASIERKMLEIAGRTRWFQVGNTISNAESGNSQLIGGNSGMRMQMGYDTLPPGFFLTGVSPTDGAVSGINSGVQTFVSEGSGGMGIPVTETLKRMIPDDSLWPYNQGHIGEGTGPGNYNRWNYHANRAAVFEKLDISNTWIENAYGSSDTIEEYNIRAQLYQYDYQRATHEALHMRRFNKATGFVNWMLNGPRPTIMWNQFDFYFNPHGGTFGTAKGNTPVHIMYDMFARRVHVMNNTREDIGAVTATLKMYDIYGNQINNTLSSTFELNKDGVTEWLNPANTVMRTMGFIPKADAYNNGAGEGNQWFLKEFDVLQIPYASTAQGRRAAGSSGNVTPWNNNDIVASLIRPTTDVFFVSLELKKGDEVLSRNDYAVPRKRDVLGSSGSAGNLIEMSQTSDLTQLNELPFVELQVVNNAGGLIEGGKYWQQTVTITNPSSAVAYGIELKAYTDATKKDLTPANYGDNLITLFPGESRTIAIWHVADNLGKAAVIDVNCYNNIINDKPIRGGNIYAPGDPGSAEWTAWGLPAQTQTSVATNIAKNVGSVVSGTPTTAPNVATAAAHNATRVVNAAFVTNANDRSNTVIDGSITNSVTLTPGQALYINLGSAKAFDRVVAHWNHATMYYWAPIVGGLGVPDKVTVQISAATGDTADWDNILHSVVFDNTKARSMTTVILLDKAYTGRHIRLIPEGTTTPSAEHGIANASEWTQEYNFGNGSVIRGGANFDHKSGRLNDSVKPRPHITGGTLGNPVFYPMDQFYISSVEVYNTYNYVYVDIPADSKITVSYADGDETKVITAASSEMDKLIVVYNDNQTVNVTIGGIAISETFIAYLNGVLYEGTGRTIRLGGELAPVTGYTTLKLLQGEGVQTFWVTYQDGEDSTSEEVVGGQPTEAPADPVKFGYKFLGWYLGDVKFDFDTPIVDDITLVAKWELIPITSLRIANAQGAVAASMVSVNRNSKVQFKVIVDAVALPLGVTWSTSNAAFATVDADGMVTIKAVAGNVTLTAKAPSGVTHSIVLRIV